MKGLIGYPCSVTASQYIQYRGLKRQARILWLIAYFGMLQFADLPVETVTHICQDLLLESKSTLAQFCATSKPILEIGAPVLWHSIKLTFDCEDTSYDRAMERLAALAALMQDQGAVRTNVSYVRTLVIDTPCLIYGASVASVRANVIDSFTYCLVKRIPTLERFEIDLCMAQFSLPSTMRHVISRLPTLQALIVTGIYAQSLDLRQTSSSLKRLAIANMGCDFHLALSCFPALTHLHVGIDQVAAGSTEESVVFFPSSLWSTLRVLMLECYQWSSHPELIDKVTDSLRVSVSLVFPDLNLD